MHGINWRSRNPIELSGTENSALCLADRTAQSIRRRSWPRWWAWTFASLVAQIAIGILEAAAGELVIVDHDVGETIHSPAVVPGSLWVVEWGDTYDHSLAGRLRPDSRPDLDGGARLRRTHLENPRSVSRSGGSLSARRMMSHRNKRGTGLWPARRASWPW